MRKKWLLTLTVNQSELLLCLTAKCPGFGLARFAAAVRDIGIDIGDNWKIIRHTDFTLTDHTEGAPNSKSDKLGKIVW